MDAFDSRITYLALASLAARWAAHGSVSGASGTPKQPSDLTPAEVRVFSQNGEDGVIEEICRRIGVAEQSFVEFGIETGVEGNCVFLAEVLGWRGLFIEADRTKFDVVARRYRDRPAITVTHALVTPANVNELITAAGFNGELDVLSIDIDSHDYWVWEAVSVVSPRLVIIEYNSHIPYPLARVQPLAESEPWNGTDYFGASLAALEQLAAQKGYSLAHTDLCGVNAFFVRSDLADRLEEIESPRRSPNFFLSGTGHPPDTSGRVMEDPSDGMPSAPSA